MRAGENKASRAYRRWGVVATAMVASFTLGGCSIADLWTATSSPSVSKAPSEQSQQAVLDLPAGEQPVPDEAKSVIATFTEAAREALLTDGEFTQENCKKSAAALQRAISPADLYNTAGTIADPDARALLLNAREKVGDAVSKCALGEVADQAKAIDAVALLEARMEKVS